MGTSVGLSVGVLFANGWMRRPGWRWALPAVILLLLGGPGVGVVHGQSLEDAPGTVIYHRPSPFVIAGFALPPNRIYTASPSIVVLPNGDYVVSHNLFGADTSPSAADSGTTFLFRSSDGGESWAELPSSPMMDMKRGSLFVHDGDLYIWGYTAAPGDIIIRRSADNGDTWTTPSDAATGLIRTGTYGGTPFNPLLHNGRIWFAQSGTRAMSAPEGADLLDAGQWIRTPGANVNNGPFGSGLVVTEAQIVGSPRTGIFLMPKVGGLPHTALIRVPSPGTITSPSDDDWVFLPGGEKKFGAAHDPVSDRFYVLSNPVLPVHEGHPSIPPELIRNTAAMLSSRDLRHWDVMQIFLYSPHISYEAFQYLNFDIDGDDMIVASRTAFDIGGNKPPRGHDSNMITFHRIENFREAAPDHFLTIGGGGVLRHEQTQHAAAPLGDFLMGEVFDGTPLGTVDGLAEADGMILVREQGGRVLRFDPLGNFVEVAAAGGDAAFSTQLDSIPQPPRGERGWIYNGSGEWGDFSHWYYWGRPDTDEEVANFGSAIGADAEITVDRAFRVKGLRFRSPHRYTITGPGSLHLAADEGAAIVETTEGEHTLQVAVELDGDALFAAAAGGELRFAGGLDMQGHSLELEGPGALHIGQAFDMGGGSLILRGLTRLSLLAGTSVVLDGTLEWRPEAGIDLQEGAIHRLIDGVEALDGATFDTVILPLLEEGLEWDLSLLHTTGEVEVSAVEEIGEAGALLWGLY